ncbi:RHS repeat-associated core domain protein [Chitinispirillum alkaliphilum]|nr:RHS repeat-associated core domain protein [Chitinispirillum alkaliphilum]
MIEQKIKLALLFVIWVCVGALLSQSQPNYVRTTVFGVGKDEAGDLKDLVSTVYSDGLGRQIQSKTIIDDNRELVTSTFYDASGRVQYVTNPFVDIHFPDRYLDVTFSDLNRSDSPLWLQYSNYGDNPQPYHEKDYYSDPLNRTRKLGAPGAEYSIESTNHSMFWYFGVNRNQTSVEGSEIQFENGFVSSELDIDVLNTLYSILLDEPFENATHHLAISRNPDGNYSQELKDVFGNVVAVWRSPTGNHSDAIIAEYEYDILGRETAEIAPKNRTGSGANQLIANTTYRYNTRGQVIEKSTPDGGIEEYTYYPAGKLKKVTTWYGDEPNRNKVREIVHYYDRLGRVERVALANSNDEHQDKLLYFYDNVNALDEVRRYARLPANIRNELKNLRGRAVARIAINRIGGVSYNVVELFGYNDQGLIDVKVKIIPGNPAPQILRFEYDIHGKLTRRIFTCGPDRIEKEFKYDRMGRLESIVHVDNDGRQLVSYTFNDLGQMDGKALGTVDGFTVGYEYNIRDWLTEITSELPDFFTQSISYEEQYSGNISSSSFNYAGGTVQYTQQYEYDRVNRLIRVNDFTEQNPDFTANFAGEYSYDAAGRFEFKEEGGNRLGRYEYFPNTSRLERTGDEVTYTYDHFGNMVIDRNKKMVIEYDWRNMPVRFMFFESIPGSEKIYWDERGTYTIVDNSYDSDNLIEYMKSVSSDDIAYALLSTVVMVYDADGNRVLKAEH